MLRFALTIFLSAFLLFQVQPLIGKYILPWFGGTSGVWNTCLVFFQVALLVGYFYAFLVSRLERKKQATVHLVLLVATLVFLPIMPSESLKPDAADNPSIQILWLLARTIGLPYLVLSTTGPLLQNWFSAANPGKSPYRLYSLSNVGSLLALITFPLYVEPTLTRAQQVWTWSGGFALFVVCCGWCAWRFMKGEGEAQGQAPGAKRQGEVQGQGSQNAPPALPAAEINPPSPLLMLLWLGLSASASALLLATTNQLTQEVAVVPFLWVIPLTLYLVSFIICFDNDRWYIRGAWGSLLLLSVPLVVALLYVGVDATLWVQIVVYSTAMFACVMTCHGELVRSRPHPKYLTLFYLVISAGGALGGAFVALLAPIAFNEFFEYHVALAAAVAVTFLAWIRIGATTEHKSYWPIPHLATLVLIPLAAVLALFIADEDKLTEHVKVYPWNDFSTFWTQASEYLGEKWKLWENEFVFQSSDSNDQLIEDSGYRVTYLLRHAMWAVPLLIVGSYLIDFVLTRAKHTPFVSWLGLMAGVVILSLALAGQLNSAQDKRDLVLVTRNFYGLLRVTTEDGYYVDGADGSSSNLGVRHRLVHGRIMHGFQFRAGEARYWPTSYYGETSGVGLAINQHPRRLDPDKTKQSLHIGMVGLGAGTVASYGRPGDRIRIYEINPAVERLSTQDLPPSRRKPAAGAAPAEKPEPCFTYLKDSLGDVQVVLGDARIMLERERDAGKLQQFDVLAIDAFTSDAIPVHLLTRECVEMYFEHLKKPDGTHGILALHISNRFINLEPICQGLRDKFETFAVKVNNSSDHNKAVSSSTWILLTKNKSFVANTKISSVADEWNDSRETWQRDEKITEDALEDIRREARDNTLAVGAANPFYKEPQKPILWTDDFASLWEVLQFR